MDKTDVAWGIGVESIAGRLSQLVSEWVASRNYPHTPETVSFGSTKKFWWRCSQGHEWEASPNNRSKGQGCPYCSNRRVLVGYNDLMSRFPEVAKEWHPYGNNGLGPEDVLYGSHKKVWWKCSQGHEWQATIANRTRGRGCPICSRAEGVSKRSFAAVKRNGSLAEVFPGLLEDWDWEKNEISPENISCASTRHVWWKCRSCGYSWQAQLAKRTKDGHRCPACSGNAVHSGFNDLATLRPDIASQWSMGLNQGLKPSDVTLGSSKKVWWECREGHSWCASVAARVKGSGCPYCANQLVLAGFNDLATTDPTLANEWHPTRNGDVSPNQVVAGSTKRKVWWMCPFGHEYQAMPASRKMGAGCPICAKEAKTSFPEQALYYYLGKVTRAESRFLFDGEYEIDVYLPELGVGIEYDGLFWHERESAKKREREKDEYLRERGVRVIRVKEVKGECPSAGGDTLFSRYQASGVHVVDAVRDVCRLVGVEPPEIDLDRDRGEIYSLYVEGRKAASLQERNPELASEWHPIRNGGLTPDMVSYSSGKSVWWLCDKSHEWLSTVDNRVKGSGCPYCAGKRVVEGVNDLGTTHPAIASEWHCSKNGALTPQMVSKGSRKKVWWRCAEGHEYSSTVSNRVNGRGCPFCASKRTGESRHRNYLATCDSFAVAGGDFLDEWDSDNNTDITPDDVTPGSSRKVWWVCKEGHRYEASVANRVAGRGCPYCSGKRLLEGFNDLATISPAVAAEWNYDRNAGLSPSDVLAGSHRKAWWRCSQGHEWEAQIKSRVGQGVGCPYCSNKRALVGYNDLESCYPDIASEWDWERNGALKPSEVVFGSGKKVWWKCQEGHEWQMPVYRRIEGRGCPVCKKKKLG